jgi:hypothetical protein
MEVREMPVERRSSTPERAQVKAPLIQELRDEYGSGANSPNTEPRIILEESTPNGPLHVYVIWSKWTDFSQQERSEMIMDALDDANAMKPEEIVRVTVAMGMTPEEWNRFQRM